MASETLDPIDCPLPPTLDVQYLLSSTFRVQLRATNHTLMQPVGRERATFGMPGHLTLCAATQGGRPIVLTLLNIFPILFVLRDLFCAIKRDFGGTAVKRVGSNGKSIRYAVSDAIVRSWMR